jgi:hypothetical protein
MSDEVRFEEDEILVDKASQLSRRTALTSFIMKMGVKTESQANYVLIGIMVAAFIATFYVISTYLL